MIAQQRLKYSSSLVFLWLLAVLLTMGTALYLSKPLYAAPETFTVTNTNDLGEGSLRQAITDANSNGNGSDMDVIEFDIPGDGPHIIKPQTFLPAIEEKVTIDGYSQPGAAANTAPSPEPINSVVKIEIDGSELANPDTPQQASGIAIMASESIVKGLSIYNFSTLTNGNPSNGNLVLVGSNTKSSGNYLGVRSDGKTPGSSRNDFGVLAIGENSAVGGTDPSDRNIVYSFSQNHISAAIWPGNGVTIYGNYIGVAKDGVTDLTPDAADANGLTAPFSFGIQIISNEVIVGGPQAGMRNLISGGTANVSISGNSAVIQGNYIGTDYTGKVRSTITNGMGIVSVISPSSLVGGTGEGEGNLIAGVKGSGIEIAALSSNIAVLGNAIHSISPFNLLGIGNSNLGIDHAMYTDSNGDFLPDGFENRGPNPNDSGDTDDGPNGFINYPVLKTAQQVGNQLTITYDLDAADSPSDTYRIEFFANNERSIFGYGPGETYLGAATSVEPGTNKTATLTVNGDFTGKALSATTTAIDGDTPSGFGSTSEFAQNISVGSADDFDADGVPDAIEDAAPNNGDGNNDGIPDKNQPTVTSYVTATVNGAAVYATLLTEGCSENGTVSSLAANSLQVKDNGYEYPYGLTDFTLYCSRGDTVNVTMYVHTQDEPQRYIPRKFNAHTNTFSDIPGSTLTSQVLGASTALKLTYSLTDGGDLDDDGEENGIIVDPVGLASEQTGVLANTGFLTGLAVAAGFLIILGTIYTYVDYRKHKKPLQEADPFLASTYTYWHHLRVVTIPLAKYRFSISIEKKEKLASPPQLG